MQEIREFIEAAPLGDKRRNKRVLTLTEALVQGQMSATRGNQGAGHTAQQAWAQTVGAYRFYDNEEVPLPGLYEPTRQALRKWIPPGERCYLVHDWSVVKYTDHQRKEDLVKLGNDRTWGYDCFTTLVLGPLGTPLGTLMQEVRTQGGVYSSQSEEVRPFVDHMSQVDRAVEESRQVLGGRERVHLIDREGDDLQWLRQTDQKQDLYVVRCQHLKRRVQYHGARRSLAEVVERVELRAQGTLERREGQGKETYVAWVGETVVTLPGRSYRGVARKRNKPQAGPPLQVRLVVAELRQGEKVCYRWVLLTNLSDPAFEVVCIYGWRWRVERFFYLAKVGFRLQEWTQENGARIARRLAVTQLAALIIYRTEQAATSEPEAQRFLEQVAGLGGWLGRKRDPIGPIVLMRGMQLLLGMLTALEELGPARLYELALSLDTRIGLGSHPGALEALASLAKGPWRL